MDGAIPTGAITGIGGLAPTVSPQTGDGGALASAPAAGGSANPFGPAIIVSLSSEGRDALMRQLAASWDAVLRIVSEARASLAGPPLEGETDGGAAMLGRLRTFLGEGGSQELVRAQAEQDGRAAASPNAQPEAMQARAAGGDTLGRLRAILGEAETRQLVHLLAEQEGPVASLPAHVDVPRPAALPPPDGERGGLPVPYRPEEQRALVPHDGQSAAEPVDESRGALIRQLVANWDAVLKVISEAHIPAGSRAGSGAALLAELRATLGEADTRQIIRILWEQDARPAPPPGEQPSWARPADMLLEHFRDGLQIHYRPEDQRLVIFHNGQDVTAAILSGALWAGSPAFLSDGWLALVSRFPDALWAWLAGSRGTGEDAGMKMLLLLIGGILVAALFYLSLR